MQDSNQYFHIPPRPPAYTNKQSQNTITSSSNSPSQANSNTSVIPFPRNASTSFVPRNEPSNNSNFIQNPSNPGGLISNSSNIFQRPPTHVSSPFQKTNSVPIFSNYTSSNSSIQNVSFTSQNATSNENTSTQFLKQNNKLVFPIPPNPRLTQLANDLTNNKIRVKCIAALDANMTSKKSKQMLRIEYLQRLYNINNPSPNINSVLSNIFNGSNQNNRNTLFSNQILNSNNQGNPNIFANNTNNNPFISNNTTNILNNSNTHNTFNHLFRPQNNQQTTNPNTNTNTYLSQISTNGINSSLSFPQGHNLGYYFIYPNSNLARQQFYNELLSNLQAQKTGYESFFRNINMINHSQQPPYLKQLHPNAILDLAQKYHYMMHLQAKRQEQIQQHKFTHFIDQSKKTGLYTQQQFSFDAFYDEYIQSQMGRLFKDDLQVRKILQTNPALVKKILDRKSDIEGYLSKKTIACLERSPDSKDIKAKNTQRRQSIIDEIHHASNRQGRSRKRNQPFGYNWFKDDIEEYATSKRTRLSDEIVVIREQDGNKSRIKR